METAADLPPSYALESLAGVAPLYTERPTTAERVLQTEHHPTGLAPAAREGLKHVYKSDHLEVRLHPPHWGLTLPAYGLGGTVDGLVTFRKQCTHVLEVSVSVRAPALLRSRANADSHASAPERARTTSSSSARSTSLRASTRRSQSRASAGSRS